MAYSVIPRLGKILKERNMTQVQLSQLTGIPQGTISKFDRNKQHQAVHLVSISRALNLSIEDLFDIEEQLELIDILQVAEDSKPYRIKLTRPEDFK